MATPAQIKTAAASIEADAELYSPNALSDRALAGLLNIIADGGGGGGGGGGGATAAEIKTAIETATTLDDLESSLTTLITSLTAIDTEITALNTKTSAWNRDTADLTDLNAPGVTSTPTSINTSKSPVSWMITADITNVDTDVIFRVVNEDGFPISQNVTFLSDGVLTIQGPPTPLEEIRLELVSETGGTAVTATNVKAHLSWQE